MLFIAVNRSVALYLGPFEGFNFNILKDAGSFFSHSRKRDSMKTLPKSYLHKVCVRIQQQMSSIERKR